jgi:hypothetical protein
MAMAGHTRRAGALKQNKSFGELLPAQHRERARSERAPRCPENKTKNRKARRVGQDSVATPPQDHDHHHRETPEVGRPDDLQSTIALLCIFTHRKS